MNREEMIKQLTRAECELVAAARPEWRATHQLRLDTNVAYFEGLDDAELATRVGLLNVKSQGNAVCGCDDGGACACTSLVRGFSTARVDSNEPIESPRERMIRENQSIASTPSANGRQRPEAPRPLPTFDGDPNASPRDRMKARLAAEAHRPTGRDAIFANGEGSVRTRVYDDADRSWTEQLPTSDPKTARERMLEHARTVATKPTRGGE